MVSLVNAAGRANPYQEKKRKTADQISAGNGPISLQGSGVELLKTK